jgi:hypothetical protein
VIRTALLIALAGALPQGEVRQANLVVRHGPGGEGLARALLASVERAGPLPALPADALEAPPPILIHLAPDEAAFEALTGGRAPEWGAGVAMPEAGVIVLPGYSSPRRGGTQELSRVLRHELAHIALHRWLGPAQVPRWFSEGYATWAAGQFDESAGWILRLAFLMRRAPPLDSLVLDWPAATADARIAYLLSASAVQYLHANGGERALAIFLIRWREGGDFERSLRATYGLTLGQLERFWGASVRRRYGWLLFFAQATVLWTLFTILLLGLFLLRRRRDRAKWQRLRAAEPPDQPAYWLEPPHETDDPVAGNDPPTGAGPA